MLARLCAFVLWALVAATAVFWGLRLLVRAPAAPPAAVVASEAASPRIDLTRLLGAVPVALVAPVAQVEANSRFRLLGIMAPKPSATAPARGVALIVVDGKLPKAFQVGAAVDGDMLLQSVSLRSAAIGPVDGAASVNLEVPPLPAPTTGKLPAVVAVPPVAAVPLEGPAARPALPAMLQTPAAAPAPATPMERAPGSVMPRPPPAANSR